MWNAQQTKTVESIRELTLDEVQAVSGGGGDDSADGPMPMPCDDPTAPWCQ